MNLLANFQNLDLSESTIDEEISEKNNRYKPFEKWVESIYEQKISITDLYLISEEIDFNLQMGEMYTIIRDRLQNVCKIHRRLIVDSVEIMWGDRFNVTKVDCEDCTDIRTVDEDESILQVKETIVWIIYQHFCSIS